MTQEVSQLPPTLGIKDPEIRSFLDALSNAWDQRSGSIDSEDKNRFITKGEFSELTNQAVLGMFAGGSDGGAAAAAGAGGTGAVASVISSISDEIKRTYLYKLLGTEFDNVNVGSMNTRIDDVIGEAKSLFYQERRQRESDIEAVTSEINLQASRIDDNNAAVLSESNTRATKDSALAQAVNTIWANVGGDSSLIQDGQLASVTPSASQATKWNQVQAAVTDPNTGKVSSTSIKQELNSYINRTDGTLRSTWSVRVESNSGGRAVVGGIGLSLTENGQSGPTIDFGVRADKFWVGDTSGSGDLPFIIANGRTYIKNAMIQDAAIDRAKIKELAIDTLQLEGESVIIPRYGDQIVTDVNLSGTYTGNVVSSTFTVSGLPAGAAARVSVIAVSQCYSTSTNWTNLYHGIFGNGLLVTEVGSSFGNYGISVASIGSFMVSNGIHEASVRMRCSPTPNGDPTKDGCTFVSKLLVMTAKR